MIKFVNLMMMFIGYVTMNLQLKIKKELYLISINQSNNSSTKRLIENSYVQPTITINNLTLDIKLPSLEKNKEWDLQRINSSLIENPKNSMKSGKI